ncbi:hypothetical protein [Sporomusa silvacetica]|uniref:hypothetical protein n=1 Tax=Sporomusa silvacetica TaxID=55504 RepID=UPI000B99F260
MWVEFLVTFIMMTGLFCTMSVKLSGTLIILLGAVIYGLLTDFVTFTPETIELLILLSLISELGGRILRIYLTENLPVSRDFSINSPVCHFGGILASDALFGSVLGFLLWELVAGKTLLPHSDTVSQGLLRLIGVAVIRFVCGITMIVIIHLYIFR